MVTISATFGAGGSVIGPALADRLGVPFLDRAIPVGVAAAIGCPLEEALVHDDRAEHGIGRLLSGAARLPNVSMGAVDVYLPDQTVLAEEDFVARTEEVIRATVATGGGVVLGRAGAVVLADVPHALHARLDGPADRRLARALAEGGPERQAGPDGAGAGPGPEGRHRAMERLLEDNDRARAAYVRHFYRTDPASPQLYHLVLDSTRLPVETVVELLFTAAQAV